MKFIRLLLWIFSVVYLLILCFLGSSSYWPSKLYWLANLFQMAPLWLFSFPVGVSFIIALLVRSKVIFLINLVSFAVIIFFIMGFNITFSGLRQKSAKTKNHLRIISCNLGTNVDVKSFSEFISNAQPDIIAFQEAYPNNQKVLKTILNGEKWHLSFQSYLGIASRLKIKNSEIIDRNIIGGRGGLIARYELEGIMGRIQFFNMHLATPRVGIEAIMDNGLGGLSEIRRIAELQNKESKIVSQWILPYKNVLITGDFNMSEANPIYKKYWHIFTNTFSKAGFGFGYTRYTSWHGARIDHLLCGSNWEVRHSEVGPNIGSDHRPVIADVEFIGISAKQTQSEELPEQKASDSTMLISENFENSLGKFQNYGQANITIDTQTTYTHGNALMIEAKEELNYVSTGIQADLWSIESYPIVSFAYLIPEGIELEVRVKTIFNDWISLGGTSTKQLIADGKWHEISINVKEAIQKILPKVKFLEEFQFFALKNTKKINTFWIDEFRITVSGTAL